MLSMEDKYRHSLLTRGLYEWGRALSQEEKWKPPAILHRVAKIPRLLQMLIEWKQSLFLKQPFQRERKRERDLYLLFLCVSSQQLTRKSLHWIKSKTYPKDKTGQQCSPVDQGCAHPYSTSTVLVQQTAYWFYLAAGDGLTSPGDMRPLSSHSRGAQLQAGSIFSPHKPHRMSQHLSTLPAAQLEWTSRIN